MTKHSKTVRFDENQPVKIATTRQWGRITGYKRERQSGLDKYRIELPDGAEQWHYADNILPSSVLAGFNTPYFWAIAALCLTVIACSIFQ